MSLNFAFGQTVNWTIETSSIRNTKVKSYIGPQANEKGEQVQTVEYIATAITEANFEGCIKVMKNTALHKVLFDYTEKAELIEKVSESEWYNYYYADPPWPLPNSDSVTKFSYTNDGKTATFLSSASPDRIERKNVKRLIFFYTDYIFTKLDNGKVKIEIKSKFQPLGGVPKWLISFWFPDGPASMIDRLVNLADDKG